MSLDVPSPISHAPKRSLETNIGGSTRTDRIGAAVDNWNQALLDFVFPDKMNLHPALGGLAELHDVVTQRIESAAPLAIDIIHSINERVGVISSREYRDLIEEEQQQWTQDSQAKLPVGLRACIDAGVTREAVASDGAMGRTPAGDDPLVFEPTANKFYIALDGAVMSKRLIHQGREGDNVGLEFTLVHTECGALSNMLTNLDSNNEVSTLIHTVFGNIDALASEFTENQDEVIARLEAIRTAWLTRENGNPRMAADGGRWVGMILKIAQRQAYKQLRNINLVMPIELFDKRNANLLTGFDSLDVLTHPSVIKAGGFTDEVIDGLVAEGLIFSVNHEATRLEADEEIDLSTELSIVKGSKTFEDLQNKWFDVKKDFVKITGQLWNMYRDTDPRYQHIRDMANKFLDQTTVQIKSDIENVTELSESGVTSDLVRRRIIHQMFRAFAYSWTLDTFDRGHPPGEHIEDHLATGDSGELGVTAHLPLGQGDLNAPSADIMFTQRSVLLHSTPGKEGLPVVAFLKTDTLAEDRVKITDEEFGSAKQDMLEMLKLWPYVVLGDIVPFNIIRGKIHEGAISRIASSALMSFNNILVLYAQRGVLPEFIPATNDKKRVVLVPALEILRVGIEAGGDLIEFRKRMIELAKTFSDEGTQRAFLSASTGIDTH